MVEHEAVKVWIVGVKEIGFMQRMEILDIGGDFHLVRCSVFDNSPKRIGSGSLGSGYSASRLAMDSGPIKTRCMLDRGKI